VSRIDAILAAQQVGVPTINMFSGKYPIAYQEMKRSVARNPAEMRIIQSNLDAWIQQNGLDPDRVQLIDEHDLWVMRTLRNAREAP
jgi:hypothetical protein